ncbi:hypothetical protein POKO110462_13570 [Pontibacter korlensis]|uniref:STAS/SEC14 domain-containing protein n=2 Tax=Pontibacter korlensis TaxID=400092 RepID=A0A0E3ZF31_9BACT|nr:hypothetical protein PKOR_14385 [Pontibacter korlensis]
MLPSETTLSYHLDLARRTIFSGWRSQTESEAYRGGMLQVADLISKNHIEYWLYNASKFTAPDLSDQAWTLEVLGPLLAETELKKIAVLVPEDVFLQAVAEGVRSKAENIFYGKIIMENFLDQQSAEDWLLSGS